MALSQIQCLDDNHVNPRTHESKPEFLYCEDQRLALETLLCDGREAFGKFMQERGLRGFLSDPELETITGTVEPFDPNSDLFPGNPAEDEPPLSLHYWPDLSDTSVPNMDLGWPDSEAYRGVTRATVYTQPPLDGQTHIKEVVRKMIAQAQKVIAVVMDVFTDVDIFRDLLDAGFKRRVSVYILLEHTNLPHFVSMCRRANMHTGHLKHLRVRCTVGGEFCTRSCTKVKGQLGHRFMFLDGDKAVSGSYGFTWMASRLDRNLITVVTGQAVDAFDRLFRVLYVTSSSVDLRQMATDQEPEPEPLPQPAAVAPPSAADTRKLYNPKYALLASCNLVPSTPQKPSSPESSKNPDDKKNRKKRSSKDTVQEDPPLHPGLVNLEKAYLIPYLPTWPEPDPPSDVIGFINIRDPRKPTQVHLQRSEMFETSQAVRFSSPFTKPKEVLPEVAQPREITPKPERFNKLLTRQKEPTAVKPTVDKDQSTELQPEPCEIKTKKAPVQRTDEPDQTVKSEHELHLNTTTKPGAKSPSQSSSNTTTPSNSITSLNTQKVTTNTPKPSTSMSELNTEEEPETNLDKTQSAVVNHSLKSNCSNDSVSQVDSKTQTGHTRPSDSSTDITSDVEVVQTQISTSSDSPVQSQSDRSPPLSENNNIELYKTNSDVCCTAPSTSFTTSGPPHDSSPSNPALPSSPTPDPPLPPSSTSSSSTLIPPPSSPSPTPDPPLPPSSVSSSSSLVPPPSSSSPTSDPPVTSSPTSLSSTLVPPTTFPSSTPDPPISSPSSLSPTLTAPVPKPRTVQLVIKDGSATDIQALPEIRVVRRSDSVESTEPAVVTTKAEAADLEQIESKTEPTETEAQAPENSEGRIEAPDDSGMRDNNIQTLNQEQNETPANPETEEAGAVGPPDDTAVTVTPAGTNPEPQTDALTLEESKIERYTNHDVSQEVSESKNVSSSDSETPPGTKIPCVDAALTDIKASEEIVDCQFANQTNDKRTKVSHCKTYHARAHEPQRILYCESSPTVVDVDSITMSPESRKSINTDGSSQHVNVTPQSNPNIVKGEGLVSGATQESQHIPQVKQNSHPHERPRNLHLTDTHMSDLHSSSADTDSEHRIPLVSSPTPTNDLQTRNSDPQQHTPDFQTPTTDISDGYLSPMDDSTLSTTSEEYYECSDSPVHDSVFDQEGLHHHGLTVDCDSVVHTNATNSSLHINNTNWASTADMMNSSRETQILSRHSKVSASSLLEKAEMEKERRARYKDRTPQSERGMKQNVVERDSQKTERRCSDEIKATTDQPKQEQGLTETAAKGKEAQPAAAKKNSLLNRSPAQRLVDGGVTQGEIITNSTDAKRTFSGGLKFSTNRLRQDKKKVVSEVASRPSDVDSSRETVRHKLLDYHSKPPLGPLQDSPAFRKPPSRPPPLSLGVGWSTAGQINVSHGQQSPVSPQSPAVDTRMRARHSPKAQTFPHFQKQDMSVGEAHRQDEERAPFTLTFSKLYNLKGLKNRVNQLPGQNRRGGGSSPPVQGHKSTG